MADEGFEFPVDRTQVMLFARSLLDIRPEYSDPNDPATKAVGGIVVPPTFVQCSAHWQPNYGLDLTRPRKDPPPAHRGDAPGGGGGGLGRGLHAEQHYEYHHPIHEGDTLKVTTRPGKRWEKEGRRGGKLMFSELHVETFGPNAAILRGKFELAFEKEKDEKKKTARGRFTLILKKFPDGWKVTHDHTSAEAPK